MESLENQIVVGCNYHTKWQSDHRMRFILVEIKGDRARLMTRTTKKDFWTDVKDLIFVQTKYNRNKAKNIKINESKSKNNFGFR